MAYDIGWIIPKLRNPGIFWCCVSSLMITIIGLLTKVLIVLLNRTTVYNKEVLMRAVNRPSGVPLITVANHHSCFDDPGLWGVLDVRAIFRGWRMRWTLVAHRTFASTFKSYFFALGKCVPVVHGAGVYQPAIDFCLERLSYGDWVHLFPEGRLNIKKEHLPFKWGVGRLVAECVAKDGHAPLIVPVWQEGLDLVMPNEQPYRIKFRKRVFVNVGEPIDIHDLVDRLKKSNVNEEETRKAITNRVQDELWRLREQTHALIRIKLGPRADGMLDNRTDILYRPTEVPTPTSNPATPVTPIREIEPITKSKVTFANEKESARRAAAVALTPREIVPRVGCDDKPPRLANDPSRFAMPIRVN